ncbi:serine/threonine-protein phosphatase [Treponema sp. TIM-1]|uniref:SpoIIE family protein phosphatase n=1 Tax=Treponema sp. TIM-1 TaxID=2898417 RepID=UPI00397E9554
MNELCTDMGFVNFNKYGEQLCGDHVEIVSPEEKLTVMVLADGLGSGVKANILSTLTAKIISTMMANSLTVEDCVETIAATLPVCKERQIAYSTFTVIRIADNHDAEIIQYDNPPVILLRQGKNFEYPKTVQTIGGDTSSGGPSSGQKTIYKTRIKLEEDDTLIAMSDGAVYAGVGRSLNLGWRRENIITFVEGVYNREYTAKTLSSLLLDKCYSLYGGEPGDDTTICTMKIRQRRPINLLIGPPVSPADVPKMMSLFFSKEGKHIICGGTTSALAAKFLGKPLETGLPLHSDPEIPPTAKISGVDLVTEGILTIHKVLEYARDYIEGSGAYVQWSAGRDGASEIARLLFEEATDINFYVGKAVNPAHQNPNLPISFSIKMRLIDELAACLKEMGKRIKVSYF